MIKEILYFIWLIITEKIPLILKGVFFCVIPAFFKRIFRGY